MGSIYTQPHDKAGKGKSALTTAALLNLKAESAAVLRLFVIYAFHDIKKLFDSMDPHILFQAVMDEQLPKGTFVLAITRHVAPRLLVLASFCAMLFDPGWMLSCGSPYEVLQQEGVHRS